ncbi:unnamed protein product [Mytilus edulis]|uniref:Uncharacterized protein n=1 Tax=Mytilus edulis TaxID=6550 RepID=A0A8S3UQC8_MYTED|nr:unnamed protein product [Mytilus edulis]
MDLVKLKSVRSGNRSAVTRLFRRLDEAKENSNFDEEEVIATLGKLVQKQTLFEDLNEQILKLTEPEDVENEIVDSDEYSVEMETKIRHIRKFIQNVQTPQSRHIDSYTTTHTLNPETIPFVPTHNIANPHNAQSFENPSVQASHTFNTQQSTFSPRTMGLPGKTNETTEPSRKLRYNRDYPTQKEPSITSNRIVYDSIKRKRWKYGHLTPLLEFHGTKIQ